MVVVTSDPLGWVSVLTSVFLTAGVGMTSLGSLLSGAAAAMRLASLCWWSLSTEDDTGTDLFGFLGTTGFKKKKKGTQSFYHTIYFDRFLSTIENQLGFEDICLLFNNIKIFWPTQNKFCIF